jgi:Fe2+ or Zn2+ uptake regulation protein
MNYTPEPIPTVTTAIEALAARGARLTVNTVNAELEALRGFDASVMEVRRTLKVWKETNRKDAE